MQSVNDFIVVKKDVVVEKKSSGGIIIESVFHHLQDYSKKNICYAEVLYENAEIPFLKLGDRIVMNPEKGTKATIEYEDFTVINKDQFIAKIIDGKFIVPPDSIMVKISKADKDALYSKWIVRDDGTKVQLFIQSEPDENSDQRSQVFVSLGEVVQIGENIKDVQIGDTAILDYTVDNLVDNVLYFDEEENKYIVIDGKTTYHDTDHWVYANRITSKDTLVSKKGDMNIVSPLLGVIRNSKLIARRPYVFLAHKSNIVEKVAQFGISYSQKEDIVEREILSVSPESKKKYGMIENQFILIDDFDVFDIQLRDGKIQCVLDQDVLLRKF